MTSSKWPSNEDIDPVGELYRRIASVESYASDLERRLRNADSPLPISRVDPLSYKNPYEGQRAVDPLDEQHMWYSNEKWRKASGPAVYEIKVFRDDESVVVGDRAFVWEIPQDLDDCKIIRAGAFVTTAGGTHTIEIVDETNGDAAVLASNIVIDAGEKSSKTGTTPTANYDVQWGYQLKINVVAGDGMGLGVWLVVQGANIANALIEGLAGPQGPPGNSVTNWTGQWLTATPYTTGESVSNNGVSYVAIDNHTSGATTEPGVGVNWALHWQVLVDPSTTASVVTITDAGSYFTSGNVEGALQELAAELVTSDPIAAILGAPSTAFEFGTSSFTGLTAIGSPDTEDANTTIPGAYYVRDDDNAWVGRYCSATPPFTVVTKLLDKLMVATDGYKAGLFISDSSPAMGSDTNVILHGNANQQIWVEVASTSNITNTPYNGMPVYFAIRVNSTTDVDFLFSPNGMVWYKIVDSRNPGFTVATCGLAIIGAGVGMGAAYDYLRIWNSAKTFPGALA